MNKLSMISYNKPVTMIFHGADVLSLQVAELIYENGGQVIIVDSYSQTDKSIVNRIKKDFGGEFIDFKGSQDFLSRLNRLDYIIYNHYTYLSNTPQFSSKTFLEETNLINTVLKQGVMSNSKVIYLDSLELHRTESIKKIDISYTPTPYSNIELQKYAESLIAEFHDNSRANVRIARLATLLGKNTQKIENNYLWELLEKAVKNKEITLKDDGLETNSLVNISDAKLAILKLLFENKSNGDVLTIANERDYTTLSIVYKLMELNPEAKEINFANSIGTPKLEKKTSDYIYTPAPNASKYGWKTVINLEQTLIDTLEGIYLKERKDWKNKPSKESIINKRLEELNNIEQSKRTVEIVKTPLGLLLDTVLLPFKYLSKGINKMISFVTPKDYTSLVIMLIIMIPLFIFIILPAIQIVYGGLVIYIEAKNLLQNPTIVLENYEKTKVSLSKIQSASSSIYNGHKSYKWIYTITGEVSSYEEIDKSLYALNSVSRGISESAVGLEPLVNYITTFEPAVVPGSIGATTTKEYGPELAALKNNSDIIKKSNTDILIAQDTIQNINSNRFPSFLSERISYLKSEAVITLNLISNIQNLSIILPEMLGLNGRVYYLVLMQNPSEMRSSGGWISTYAIVSFERGQIKEINIDDIYNLSGQLDLKEILIEAPESYKLNFPDSRWSVENANWSPEPAEIFESYSDFIISNGNYYRIDGMIVVNTNLVKDLLDIYAPISVPNYPEVVNSANFDSLLLTLHSNFEPGETDKVDSVKDIVNTLIAKLTQSDSTSLNNLGRILISSLNKKNIYVYSNISSTNEYFRSQNWSNKFPKESITPYMVEWNYGGNKTNIFLDKQTSYKVDIISDKEINVNTRLSYKNRSTSSTYPQGDYRAKVRVYIPNEAINITTTGTTDSSVIRYKENNRNVVSVDITVPPLTDKEYTISYTLSNSKLVTLDDRRRIIIPIYLYKQSGYLNEKFKLDIVHPQVWTITDKYDLVATGNYLSVQKEFTSDLNYEILWTY